MDGQTGKSVVGVDVLEALNDIGRALALLTSLRLSGVDEKILQYFESGVQQGEADICQQILPDAAEEALLQEGKIINCIKHFKERTGCGLYGAKMTVDHWRTEKK